jgi:hypothetical protein
MRREGACRRGTSRPGGAALENGGRLTVLSLVAQEQESRGCCDTRSVLWNDITRGLARGDGHEHEHRPAGQRCELGGRLGRAEQALDEHECASQGG